MPHLNDFGVTPGVTITVLVDNRADLLVQSTDSVQYCTDQPLVAEHGFAALVDLPVAGKRILWDSGATRLALMENLRRLKIDPASIDQIVLSHGHDDHTTGVAEVLRAMDLSCKPRQWEPEATTEEIQRYARGRRVPLVLHPAALRERWSVAADGTRKGPDLPPSVAEWQALGADVILADQPFKLAPGCWTTGAIPRRSFETAGTSATRAYREGDAFQRDYVDDDQALVFNVEGKGLVVLTGCAHAGIVNTVQQARDLSGVDAVWAVIGGFHLAKATDEDIERSIEALQAWRPNLVAPSHCTGFKALCQFAAKMPEAFVQGLVGAKYVL